MIITKHKNKLNNILNLYKNNLNDTGDKIKYLTNSLNSILNELGKSENVITASNKEIELILGECYTLEYFISKYDLDPSIKIKTYTDAIEIIALSL